MSTGTSPTCPEMTKDLLKTEMSGPEDIDLSLEAAEAVKLSPVRFLFDFVSTGASPSFASTRIDSMS